MMPVDRDLRDWLRSLAVHHDDGAPPARGELSEEGAAYLERIARDGTPVRGAGGDRRNRATARQLSSPPGVILVDEYAALPALVGRPPAQLAGEALALTYSRAYRLTRALLDPGPGRLATRGRFTRLVEALNTGDQQMLHERLADPDPHGGSDAEHLRRVPATG